MLLGPLFGTDGVTLKVTTRVLDWIEVAIPTVLADVYLSIASGIYGRRGVR